MNKKNKFALFFILSAGIVLLFIFLISGNDVPVLNPKGQIADQQRNLIVFGTLLSLIVVIPVFILTFYIAWKYREGNHSAKYTPDWDHSRILESIWWGIPLVLILILSAVTWKSSHDLDPFKPLNASAKPMKIQVIALDWKWLFIYPDQNIATVNFVQFPEKTPVDFEITSDAPMNSFWIPSLGGQIYAMSGMSAHLHLMADKTGTYNGSSANISGRGFAGMKFTASSSSSEEFSNWVNVVKLSTSNLNMDEYKILAKPSENNPVKYYASEEGGLYNQVVMKFMPNSNVYSAGHQ